MAHTISGVFTDSKRAGQAVSELKAKGMTDTISVLTKNWDGTEVKTVEQKDDAPSQGLMGALVGGLAGLLFGSAARFVPGMGTIMVAGPFAALMSATGAITGGLLGFLSTAGIPEERARKYEDAVRSGEVLVNVGTEHEEENRVRWIMEKYDVRDTYTAHTGKA